MQTLADVRSSLESVVAFDPRDWSLDKRDAWIYGIVFGWESEELDEDPMGDVAKRHGWDDAAVQRLRELHEAFVEGTR